MPVWDLGGAWRREDISLPDYLSEDELDSLPAFLLVLLLVAVLCIVYRFLRCRTRPRRKRHTRLRRLMTSIRVPAVWSVAPLHTALLLAAELCVSFNTTHHAGPADSAATFGDIYKQADCALYTLSTVAAILWLVTRSSWLPSRRSVTIPLLFPRTVKQRLGCQRNVSVS